jgi:hypothetical protein
MSDGAGVKMTPVACLANSSTHGVVPSLCRYNFDFYDESLQKKDGETEKRERINIMLIHEHHRHKVYICGERFLLHE